MKKRSLTRTERTKIIVEHFADLDRHLKTASIAILKRGKQSTPTESCFGGVFVGQKDSVWPEFDGEPLDGVLQIRTKDLPFRPKELKGVSLIQIFVPCETWPSGLVNPRYDDGENVVVRSFSSLRGLHVLEKPFKSDLKPCRIEWKKVENEIPTYPDDIGLVDDEKQERFRELPDWSKVLGRSYSTNPRTKVGGWPNSCQNGLNYRGYAIQIGSEQKANFMWGHDGTAVLYRVRSKWSLDWDCF